MVVFRCIPEDTDPVGQTTAVVRDFYEGQLLMYSAGVGSVVKTELAKPGGVDPDEISISDRLEEQPLYDGLTVLASLRRGYRQVVGSGWTS
ncbi:MAG: hypothetical protein DLM60_23710 [Pseudonocardiales bacterium]|nr:MAG: hypothetical protein DLM60_23710 [Pseudonocardiales bacterium]